MIKVVHKDGTDFDLPIICEEALIAGICVFEFKKADDSVRRAIGTINGDFIPVDKNIFLEYESTLKTVLEESENEEPITDITYDQIESMFVEKEKKERKQNLEIQRYYDFESKGWRSFKKSSLIAIYK